MCAAGALAGGVLLSGTADSRASLARQFGASITGAFEGWFYNPGRQPQRFSSATAIATTSQALDVPIGPNNRIEPGGPDLGQPTHFLPGRQYGMFIVPVPKEFTPQQQFTWTIVANGQTTSIPLRINTDYVVSPFSDVAVKNTPPVAAVRAGRSDHSGSDREHRRRPARRPCRRR